MQSILEKITLYSEIGLSVATIRSPLSAQQCQTIIIYLKSDLNMK